MNATLDQVLQSPWARWINRILADYPDARARLVPHAGKVARFQSGPFDLALAVTADGAVEVASRMAPVDLEVRVPPALLPRLARRDESAERDIAFTGDTALGADIRFLSRHLKWDVEADIGKALGDGVAADIVAHRVVGALKDLAGWQQEARERMGANIREYLTEERPALVPRRDVERFGRDVETLRDDVARLEARIRLLQESKN
ncbi:MAG: ubiquinone biosynthesis protein [Betaproteobacteria bacterium]|nr:ubiquinone biosynthesis protein [Betaproteobacteria bacterium]